VDLDHEVSRFSVRRETAESAVDSDDRCVAILLSIFNGEEFLDEQLRSYWAQTHHNWKLYWRDDGSTDGSVPMMRTFANAAGVGRCAHLAEDGQLGPADSFLSLLRVALRGEASYFAYSDQDDVWLPKKLAHAVAALNRVPGQQPAIYFCPRIPVDSDLQPVGKAPGLRRPPGFPAALTQNVIPGCCMILNRSAAQLIDSVQMPERTWHDWWSYLVVTANDGVVITGKFPDVLYRQHAGNLIGEPIGLWRRAVAALRRGRRPFLSLLWRHIAALRERPGGLPDKTYSTLETIIDASRGGLFARARALRLPGLVRQTWLETLVFRLWFLMG
jgi:hypothetical protein